MPLAEAAHCDQEILRLLSRGAVVTAEPTADQFLSPFFLREKFSDGMRFILNLKDLNEYVSPPPPPLQTGKLEDSGALDASEYGNGDTGHRGRYLLVPIHPLHRKFLRFQWRGVTYEFTILPFGLSTAPYIFTKIVRPAVSFLREEGFESVVYLDDFLLLGSSKASCQANVQAHINLLSSLGFLINF